MPELPEVETVVRKLNRATFVGRPIQKCSVLWPKTIQFPSVFDFIAQITGKTIFHFSRRGKWILCHLEDEWTLLIHLRMSGRLVLQASAPYQRVCFTFGNSALSFCDPRKFGRMVFTQKKDQILKKLGLEPLEGSFTSQVLQQILHKKRGNIKATLLDQTILAGIGNIYADEALWHAKIHPNRSPNTLNAQEIDALFHAIRAVLSNAIAHRGTSLGSGSANFHGPEGKIGAHQYLLTVFQRQGLPCPRCLTNIEKIRIAQRGTHICPTCQVTN